MRSSRRHHTDSSVVMGHGHLIDCGPPGLGGGQDESDGVATPSLRRSGVPIDLEPSPGCQDHDPLRSDRRRVASVEEMYSGPGDSASRIMKAVKRLGRARVRPARRSTRQCTRLPLDPGESPAAQVPDFVEPFTAWRLTTCERSASVAICDQRIVAVVDPAQLLDGSSEPRSFRRSPECLPVLFSVVASAGGAHSAFERDVSGRIDPKLSSLSCP